MSAPHHPERGGLGKAMPTYLVLDVSQSMHEYETQLNRTLSEIIKMLYLNPRISEFIHLSIITFSSRPSVVVRMTELTRMRQMPKVTCQGRTCFAPLFELLRDRIDIDVPLLVSKGYSVLRPVVFLLTDGAPADRPSDAWVAPHQSLVDPSWKRHPRIIGFGFRDAVEEVLRQMCPTLAYLADPSQVTDTEALSQAMSGMLGSMVASAQAHELRLPSEVAGYHALPDDYVEE